MKYMCSLQDYVYIVYLWFGEINIELKYIHKCCHVHVFFSSYIQFKVKIEMRNSYLCFLGSQSMFSTRMLKEKVMTALF